jgi:hypothetical protein
MIDALGAVPGQKLDFYGRARKAVQKGDVVAIGQLEILLSLGLLDLLAVDGLGNLFLLLDNVYHVTVTICFASAARVAYWRMSYTVQYLCPRQGRDEPVTSLRTRISLLSG